jgi:hypothetical protein
MTSSDHRRRCLNDIDEGLRALIARGFRFQHLTDPNGDPMVLVGAYGWPEFYDRIHIHSEEAAVAARAVVDSLPGIDEVVWTHEADTLATINALLDLPKPEESGAPRLARRAPSALWLPNSWK